MRFCACTWRAKIFKNTQRMARSQAKKVDTKITEEVMNRDLTSVGTTELYNIWRKHAPPSLKPKTWRGLVPADANWSRLLVVTTDQKGNTKLQTKVFAPLVVSKK